MMVLDLLGSLDDKLKQLEGRRSVLTETCVRQRRELQNVAQELREPLEWVERSYAVFRVIKSHPKLVLVMVAASLTVCRRHLSRFYGGFKRGCALYWAMRAFFRQS